jgi:Uma2 family endonuclease
MSTATKHQLYTFEEFCDLVPEGQKADLIDGVIYMASPDNLEHNDINFWLYGIIFDYLEERMILGKLQGSKVAFRLGPMGGPEPDIGYIQPGRLHVLRETYVDGPPDLAVEIVSPDSIERDYEKKRDQYEKSGVGEYWIIDPMKEKMTCLVRSEKGKFKKVKAVRGKIASRIIPGFWVRPAWFWQVPLPKKKNVLAEILSGKD